MSTHERQDTPEAMDANKRMASDLLSRLANAIDSITDPVDAECVRLQLEELLEQYE